MLLNDLCSDTGERPPPPRSDPLRIAAFTGAPVERHEYRPAASSRWIGLGGTMLTACLAVAGFLVTVSTSFITRPAAPTLTVMELRPLASPPETPPREKEAPDPVDKKEKPPESVQVVPVKQMIVSIAPVTAPSPPETKTVDIAPKEPETAAPKTMPAPPAPQVSSNGPDTWEGRILAALNKQRRYPRMALIQRKQGISWIRFVMNREGRVLSVRLERSSGVPDLDREAVALPKRVQPLPAPPDDRPGNTLELVVPVEFFMR